MILLLIILLTALAGFALTLYLTGGFDARAGNPVAAVLVAVAIALLWSRGFMTLERDYLMSKFHKVRRKLLLWGTSLGVEEVALLRLFMAVEGREQEEIQRCIDTARSLDLLTFTRAWTYGAGSRLQGDLAKAVAAFSAGAEAAEGIDRAELLCEAGIAVLQSRSGLPATTRREDLQRAIRCSNEADQLLRDVDPGRDQLNRYRYVVLLQRTLRAMIYLAQGRSKEGRRRLDEVAASARLLASLRARRLAVLCRIEQLPAILSLEGDAAYRKERAAIRKASTLPLLRLRLSELEGQLQRKDNPDAPSSGSSDSNLFGPVADDAEGTSRRIEDDLRSAEALRSDRDPAVSSEADGAAEQGGRHDPADEADDLITLPDGPETQLRLEIPDRM